MKNFKLRERSWIRFQILASNALNHPNYLNPNTTITAAGPSRPSSSTARTV